MNGEEKILQLLEKVAIPKLESLETEVKQVSSVQNEQVLPRLDTLESEVQRVAVTQEQQILPAIQLLTEGHESILEQTAFKEGLDAAKTDLETFKLALKTAIEA